MDASELVAERFQYIIDHQLHLGNMNDYDRAIWYITATACEEAINGFESIFEQFLTPEQLIQLELSLRSIHENELAYWFGDIRLLLVKHNFWSDNIYDINKLPEDVQTEFEKLKKNITLFDQMSNLDDKIVSLLKKTS